MGKMNSRMSYPLFWVSPIILPVQKAHLRLSPRQRRRGQNSEVRSPTMPTIGSAYTTGASHRRRPVLSKIIENICGTNISHITGGNIQKCQIWDISIGFVCGKNLSPHVAQLDAPFWIGPPRQGKTDEPYLLKSGKFWRTCAAVRTSIHRSQSCQGTGTGWQRVLAFRTVFFRS